MRKETIKMQDFNTRQIKNSPLPRLLAATLLSLVMIAPSTFLSAPVTPPSVRDLAASDFTRDLEQTLLHPTQEAERFLGRWSDSRELAPAIRVALSALASHVRHNTAGEPSHIRGLVLQDALLRLRDNLPALENQQSALVGYTRLTRAFLPQSENSSSELVVERARLALQFLDRLDKISTLQTGNLMILHSLASRARLEGEGLASEGLQDRVHQVLDALDAG
jgi:hypothetical protein